MSGAAELLLSCEVDDADGDVDANDYADFNAANNQAAGVDDSVADVAVDRNDADVKEP